MAGEAVATRDQAAHGVSEPPARDSHVRNVKADDRHSPAKVKEPADSSLTADSFLAGGVYLGCNTYPISDGLHVVSGTGHDSVMLLMFLTNDSVM